MAKAKQYKPFNGTAKERIAHHKDAANAAYKSGNYISARNHEKAYNQASNQLNRFMRKDKSERDAIVAGMRAKRDVRK